MGPSWRIAFSGLAVGLALASQGVGEPLRPGETSRWVLGEGDALSFELELAVGMFSELRVEQCGVDILARLRDPAGREASTDSPIGDRGPEILPWIATTSGRHVLTLSVVEGTGEIELWLAPPRPATAADTRRVAAHRQAEAGQRALAESDLVSARSAFEEALGGLREVAEGAGEEAAWIGYQLGQVAQRLGDLATAEEALDAALASHRQRHDRHGEATVLNQLGRLARQRGDDEAARHALEQAAVLWRELGDEGREARALTNLASAHLAFGRPREALELQLRGRDLFARVGDRRRLALASNNLGGLASRTGDLLTALDQYGRARELATELGMAHLEAQLRNNLGALESRLGEPHAALEDYLAARDLFAQLGAAADEAAAANNLGALLVDLGAPDSARPHLERALVLAEAVGEGRTRITTLVTLARVELETAGAAAALALLDQAASSARQLDDGRGQALVWRQRARVYDRAGQPALALAAADRALSLFRDLGDLEGEAQALLHRGRALAARGDRRGAWTALQAALALDGQLADPSRQAVTWLELARLERAEGDLRSAHALLEQAVEAIESVRAEVAGDALRAHHFASRREAYELLLDVEVALHWAEPDAGWDQRAFQTAERARARGWRDVLERARVEVLDPALASEERASRRRVAAAAQRAEGSTDAADGQSLERQLAEHRLLLARLDALEPRRAELHREVVRGIDLERHWLDEETALLAFSLGDERGFVQWISREGLRIEPIPGRAQLEAEVARLRRLLTGGEGDRGALATSLGELSHQLLGRVLGDPPAPIRRLAVVPDGALYGLPFALLPRPDRPQEDLLSRYELVTLPSATVLAGLRRAPVSRGTLVVIADPVTTPDDPRLTSSGQAGAGQQRTGQPVPGQDWPRLPWSGEEARVVGALAVERGMPVRRFEGFAARRAVLLGDGVVGARWLHLATHGRVDDHHPELSALVLSRYDSDGRRLAGELSLADLYRLDLPVDLLTLSGCHTAGGELVRGEGVIGLTRGFFLAGARRVVASLWAVEDRATAELMERFYRGLLIDGLGPAAALRRAQLELRAKPRWRSPTVWAPFVLYGDWQEAER